MNGLQVELYEKENKKKVVVDVGCEVVGCGMVLAPMVSMEKVLNDLGEILLNKGDGMCMGLNRRIRQRYILSAFERLADEQKRDVFFSKKLSQFDIIKRCLK